MRVSYKKKYLKNNFFPILKVAEEGSEEYSERLSELGLPKLEERRHQADMAMVHKILCGQGSLDSSQWFEFAAYYSVRATRSTANPINLKMRQGRLKESKSGGTSSATEL